MKGIFHDESIDMANKRNLTNHVLPSETLLYLPWYKP